MLQYTKFVSVKQTIYLLKTQYWVSYPLNHSFKCPFYSLFDAMIFRNTYSGEESGVMDTDSSLGTEIAVTYKNINSLF